MTDAFPEDVEWLCQLVSRSQVLADDSLREHWQRIIPWMTIADRYALAAILLEVEHACND